MANLWYFFSKTNSRKRKFAAIFPVTMEGCDNLRRLGVLNLVSFCTLHKIIFMQTISRGEKNLKFDMNQGKGAGFKS